MRKVCYTIIAILVIGSPAYAVNSLQLFINGPNYDLNATSLKTAGSDMLVSMALAQTDEAASLDVAGRQYSHSDWMWGYALKGNEPAQWTGREDLSRLSTFPTWLTELPAGNYQSNVWGNYWNPAIGRASASTLGREGVLNSVTGDVYSLSHFDRYPFNRDWGVVKFAPVSHNTIKVCGVPEPSTFALLAMGLLGLGGSVRRRLKSK